MGSVAESGAFTRFFNPRSEEWADHFQLEGTRIRGITEIGEVTVKILRFNDPERLIEREALIAIGRYPARRR